MASNAARDSFGRFASLSRINWQRPKHGITTCPQCGQRMRVMFGASFEPKKWLLLSAIKDATEGRGGIEGAALTWMFYPRMARHKALQNIKSQVCQINDELVHTDWRIVNTTSERQRGAFYKLMECK